jgi:hypothetical protein
VWSKAIIALLLDSGSLDGLAFWVVGNFRRFDNFARVDLQVSYQVVEAGEAASLAGPRVLKAVAPHGGTIG